MTWENLLKADFEEKKEKLLSQIKRLQEQIEDERDLTDRMRSYVKMLKEKVEELEDMLE